MRYFFFPEADATLYEQFGTRQSGLDEILEVGKSEHGAYRARAAVRFDIASVSASAAAGLIPPEASYDLILYSARADKLKFKQGVEVRDLAEAWDEGTGYFYQDITQSLDGATWTHAASGSAWTTEGGTTGSLSASAQFVPVDDFTVEITEFVRAWLSGSESNDGVLLKFPEADEADGRNQGNIKFFSKDTHTIYRPVLVARWNDQTYDTSSLQAWPTASLLVLPSGLKSDYRVGETVRVNLAVRERFPLKTFANSMSRFDGNRALPAASYFSIIDEQANLTVIPFSDESRVSADGQGSYVKFAVQNMHPRRYYRLIVKVEHDGLEEVFDGNAVFRVRD